MFICSPGAEGGGVKRSIGEIVDEDAPVVPRKKKYAKEAWPGATKFCQVKKNNRIILQTQFHALI